MNYLMNLLIFNQRIYIQEEIPNNNWTKKRLTEWLISKQIDFPQNAMKDEIWKIASQNLPQRRYHLDEYVLHHGHMIVRLPPYHCHFNAIEMVWSECKRWYDENIVKTNSAPEDVLRVWSEAINNVSPEHWKNYVNHTETVICAAWETEKYFDITDIQPIIITNSDGESSGEEFDTDVDTEYGEP